MGGEEHDAGVEGPAELGHRGYTFLNDPTPGSAAEFAQEEGSLRLGKPIADDVARVGDPGSYRLVDNVDVLEVGSPGRSAHGGRGAQVMRMIQSDSASLTFRKQDRPSRVSSSNADPDLASELRTDRRSVAPATSSSIVSTVLGPSMRHSMHPWHPRSPRADSAPGLVWDVLRAGSPPRSVGRWRERREPLAGVRSSNARSHGALVARSGTRWRRTQLPVHRLGPDPDRSVRDRRRRGGGLGIRGVGDLIALITGGLKQAPVGDDEAAEGGAQA